jgi:hypothetical protein
MASQIAPRAPTVRRPAAPVAMQPPATAQFVRTKHNDIQSQLRTPRKPVEQGNPGRSVQTMSQQQLAAAIYRLISLSPCTLAEINAAMEQAQARVNALPTVRIQPK